MTSPTPRNWLPARFGGSGGGGGGKDKPARTEPPFDPSSWSGALIVMCSVAALLWVIEIVNATNDYSLDRFGLRPRRIDGLWGIVTEPFLHASSGHLFSNTVPLIGIGWVLLLSGIRTWLTVSGLVLALGGLATWLVAPGGPHVVIVGASGLVFGWLGYLIARAYFSRKLGWIIVAVIVLLFFGTLLNGLLPSFNSRVSWQAHLCGFAAGIAAGALLHPRQADPAKRPARSTPPVS